MVLPVNTIRGIILTRRRIVASGIPVNAIKNTSGGYVLNTSGGYINGV